ncbi:hypothetical protein, partial [Mesorhizobium japonicum]|uniref:hypothetical protein n=1 Tax=Mesorhizobium japonicum TaxID=2066070 RepID=UPI003B5A850C
VQTLPNDRQRTYRSYHQRNKYTGDQHTCLEPALRVRGDEQKYRASRDACEQRPTDRIPIPRYLALGQDAPVHQRRNDQNIRGI